jgi:hypothetical protein
MSFYIMDHTQCRRAPPRGNPTLRHPRTQAIPWRTSTGALPWGGKPGSCAYPYIPDSLLVRLLQDHRILPPRSFPSLEMARGEGQTLLRSLVHIEVTNSRRHHRSFRTPKGSIGSLADRKVLLTTFREPNQRECSFLRQGRTFGTTMPPNGKDCGGRRKFDTRQRAESR